MLNFILIPKFAAVGASITALATNILMFVMSMVAVPRITHYNYRKIGKIILKAFTATIFMILACLYLKTKTNIFIVITLSGIVYLYALYAVKGFDKKDVISIFKSFART